MMLTDLDETLRGFGLDVVEVDGWRDRGHGEMSDVLGVTCHHTASGRGTGRTLGLATVVKGRRSPDPKLDLPGPLAQLYLNREGVFYIVAAGLSYHAGVSRKPTYTNRHRIGIEALAAGDGWVMDWPDIQVEAYALGCKALSRRYRFPVDEVLGHKETCFPENRKIDPTLNMVKFRNKVDKATARPKDEPMSAAEVKAIKDAMLTPAQIEAAVEKVLKTSEIVPNRPTAKQIADAIAAGKPVPETTYFTLAKGVGNVEGDDDDRFAIMNAKLDAILAALEPPAAP